MAARPLAPPSPLATQAYTVLRRRVPAAGNQATLTYKALGHRLRVHYRGRALHDALGELAARCKARRLPVIVALVVRADLGMPGSGYYGVAHQLGPRPKTIAALAWAREVTRVCSTTYPSRL